MIRGIVDMEQFYSKFPSLDRANPGTPPVEKAEMVNKDPSYQAPKDDIHYQNFRKYLQEQTWQAIQAKHSDVLQDIYKKISEQTRQGEFEVRLKGQLDKEVSLYLKKRCHLSVRTEEAGEPPEHITIETIISWQDDKKK